MAKKRWMAGLGVLCGILLLGVFHAPLLRGMGAFLVYESHLQPCQVIFVLGGSEGERLEKAITLYREGYGQRLLLAVPATVSPEAPYRDLLAEEIGITQGILAYREIPPEVVRWSPRPLYSTSEELQFLKAWAETEQVHSAIIVTGWFQSRRAYWSAARVLEPISTVCVVPAPGMDYPAGSWWKSMEGVIDVENEYLKNLVYLFWPS
ncbi:MAG: YdcF family protein [bacterium]|jgi:uncharacterized SAM-binding protein YcdF (DUF218 family)|nr:YdcF family protein [bacterium]